MVIDFSNVPPLTRDGRPGGLRAGQLVSLHDTVGGYYRRCLVTGSTGRGGPRQVFSLFGRTNRSTSVKFSHKRAGTSFPVQVFPLFGREDQEQFRQVAPNKSRYLLPRSSSFLRQKAPFLAGKKLDGGGAGVNSIQGARRVPREFPGLGTGLDGRGE